MTQESEIKKRQLDALKERQKKAAEMGGGERVARQKESGKLNARERIGALLDKGTFRETGMFARSRGATDVTADGVITGYGKIDGKKVYIYSQDFTSNGGTLSEIHAQKICRALESATKDGCPVIGLNDSGGARIQDGVDALAGFV